RDEDRRGEGPAARGDAATEEEEDSGPYGDAEEDARGKPRAEEEDRGSDHLQVGADAGLLRPGMDRVLEEGVGEDRPPAVRGRAPEEARAGDGQAARGDAATEDEEASGAYGDAEEDARGKPRAEEADRGSDHLQVGADAGLLRPGMDRVLEEGVGEDRPPAVRVREVEQPHAHGREPQGDADGEKKLAPLDAHAAP